MSKLNRREFLHTAGLAAAVVGLTACGANQTSEDTATSTPASTRSSDTTAVGLTASPSSEPTAAATQPPEIRSTPTTTTEFGFSSELKDFSFDQFNRSLTAWRQTYVVKDGTAGSDQLRVITTEADFKRGTVSEGQMWGEELASFTNDTVLFDSLERYAVAKQDPKGHMSWYLDADGGFHLKPDGTREIGSATDADMSRASAHITMVDNNPAYKPTALKLVNLLMEHNVDQTTFILKPGDMWAGTAFPSYLDFSMFQQFRDFTGDDRWDKVIDSNRQILEKINARYPNNNGLMPNQSKLDGTPAPNNSTDTSHNIWGYDSCRYPWRLLRTLQYDPHSSIGQFAQQQLIRINQFFESRWPDVVSGYDMEGKPKADYLDIAFAGAVACAAVVSKDQAYQRATVERLASMDDNGLYYHGTLKPLYLYEIGGRGR